MIDARRYRKPQPQGANGNWLYDHLTMFVFPFFAGPSRDGMDERTRIGPPGKSEPGPEEAVG